MTDFVRHPWQVDVLTLFPEMFPGFLGQSIAGKALEQSLWTLNVTNIRDFAQDRHKTVDDTPFGGGAGMVMRPDVISDALTHVMQKQPQDQSRPVIYLSPRGQVLKQDLARELADGPGAILVCGRYEGIDQRVIDQWNMTEISIGDYVLSGGEPAAMVLMDACIRLLPGVLGAEETLDEESFERDLLEYPHYTRPRTWQGLTVPDVLLSGHHENIRTWRLQQAQMITQARRPDLWKNYTSQTERKSSYE